MPKQQSRCFFGKLEIRILFFIISHARYYLRCIVDYLKTFFNSFTNTIGGYNYGCITQLQVTCSVNTTCCTRYVQSGDTFLGIANSTYPSASQLTVDDCTCEVKSYCISKNFN